MRNEREQRFLTLTDSGTRLEVRSAADGSEGRRLVGYAAVFDSDSEDMGFIERIAPGAFTDALKFSDVRALFNHDANHVLGRLRSKTLRLSEDERGLRYEVDLPDTTLARDLAHLVERGDITGNSFSFTVAEDAWDREANERTITRVGELFDVGRVTYPAYAETTVSARALEMAEKLKAAPADVAREREHYELTARSHELA